MNFTISLPKRKKHLSLTEWMIKHNVSSKHCSLSLAISRAQNALDNEHI